MRPAHTDSEIGLHSTSRLHLHVLSTKEQTPKVRSSLLMIDRWKHAELQQSSSSHPKGTPCSYPHHAATRAALSHNRTPRSLGCYRSIAPIFGISKLRCLARATTRRLQGPGGLTFTPHRDAWYAATKSYAKDVEVVTVGIAPTLTFRRVRRWACTKTLKLGVLVVNLTFWTHPSSPSNDVPPQYPQQMRTICSWARRGKFVSWRACG